MSTTASTTPDPSKTCQVINQTDTDVVIIIPTTAQDGDSNSAIAVYDQDIEVLSTVEGGTIIQKGQTGTVVLDQYYTDPETGEQDYSLVYNLLVSSANWYYPLANIGVMQNFFANPPEFDPQTATLEEQKSIQNADLFYQTIQAYPTSQLATDYQDAMSGTMTTAAAQADGSPDSTENTTNAINDSADAFFKSTKQFQDVTLASLVAIETYYNEFPFIWAQYKSTTYFLYSSDGQTTSFTGQLSLTQPAAIDLTLPNSGYTCTFTPASDSTNLDSTDVDASQAVALTYINGVFVNDPNVDIPAIAVKGIFQLKSVFTQVTTDTDIVVVITGTVNNVTCIGFDEPQLQDDDTDSYWKTLFEPQGAEEIINSIMTIGGAIMMFHFFATGLYGIGKKLFGKKKPTTQDEFKAKMDEIEQSMTKKIDEAVQKISDGKQSAPKDPAEAMQKVSDQSTNVLNQENRDNEKIELKKESDDIEVLAQDEGQMSSKELQELNSEATGIQKANKDLVEAPQEGLGDVVNKEQQNIESIQTNVNSLNAEVSSSISAQSEAQMKENAEVSKELNDEIEESEKEHEEVKEESDVKAEKEVKPFEEI